MKKNEEGIFHGVIYHPYSKPCFRRAVSGRVLDFKQKLDKGMRFAEPYFARFLNEQASDGDVVVTVPSSKEFCPTSVNASSRLLTRMLRKLDLVDGTSFLRRIEGIPKAANGGPRSIHIHIRTIMLVGDVRGKRVLLFDDVSTTGSSLLACKQILEDAGATSVVMFALGQTCDD